MSQANRREAASSQVKEKGIDKELLAEALGEAIAKHKISEAEAKDIEREFPPKKEENKDD